MHPRLEIYEGRRGLARRKQWRWRIVARNGRIIANGGDGYANRADLIHALTLVRSTLTTEPL